MKKKYLLLLSLVSLVSMAFGQLSVTDTAGNAIANGDTAYVYGVVGYQCSGRYYVNNSSKAVTTNVFCVPTATAVSGCTYSICVGSACYKILADNVNFLSPNFSAPSGKDTNALYTDYNPKTAGTTVIRYDIRTSTLTDSAWFFVKFIATPTGVATISANDLHVSPLYPNPATSMVNFTYHTDYTAQMNIYNSLGQMVKTISLSAAKENMSINVADMPSGIYICMLQAAGAESAFRKLVVSH